jgi:hypothetical protein
LDFFWYRLSCRKYLVTYTPALYKFDSKKKKKITITDHDCTKMVIFLPCTKKVDTLGVAIGMSTGCIRVEIRGQNEPKNSPNGSEMTEIWPID